MKKILVSALAVLSLVSSTGFGLAFKEKKNLPKSEPTVELDTSNTVVLRGEVTDDSVSKLIKDIELNNNDLVYLYIQSPGGSVLAGMKAVSYIRSTPKKIVCIADITISMAAVILAICDERISTDNSVYMQHVTTYGVRMQQAPNAESFVKFLTRMAELMDVTQAQRVGLSYDDFKTKTRNDWWSVGADLLTQKITDRAAQVTCTRRAMQGSVDEVLSTPFGSLLVSWSACPLVSSPLSVKAAGFYGNYQKLDEYTRKLNIRDSLFTLDFGNSTIQDQPKN